MAHVGDICDIGIVYRAKALGLDLVARLGELELLVCCKQLFPLAKDDGNAHMHHKPET